MSLEIFSTRVRRRAGQWITRVPAGHAFRTVTGANEMKWMRWVWRNGGMKFVEGENERNPEKTLPRSRFVHHETQWSARDAKSVTSVPLIQWARVRSPVGSISWLRFLRGFPSTARQMSGNLGHIRPRLSYGHNIPSKPYIIRLWTIAVVGLHGRG